VSINVIILQPLESEQTTAHSIDLQRFNTHPMETRDSAIRVVCISYTHDTQPSVPGDVLIHAGDLTPNGTAEELHAAVTWISCLPHPIKIVVAGNHDKILDAHCSTRELLDSPIHPKETTGNHLPRAHRNTNNHSRTKIDHLRLAIYIRVW
jgi:hypothetical protein